MKVHDVPGPRNARTLTGEDHGTTEQLSSLRLEHAEKGGAALGPGMTRLIQRRRELSESWIFDSTGE
jgi:hypothetical protein